MTLDEAIDKARKLLAKGNNAATSPEESAAFLAKAQQIINDYKLDVNGLDYDENQTKDDAEPVQDFGYSDPLDHVTYGQYRNTWTTRLASILSTHNQTRIVFTTHADRSITIKIIGRASDVQVVRYLYAFFKRQVEELAKPACKGHSTAFRGQFCMGVLDTLWWKLSAEKEKSIKAKREELSGNSTALVRIDKALARIEKRAKDVDEFIEETMGDLRKGRGGSFRTETGGRTAGQIAGRNLRMTSSKAALGSTRREIE